MKTWIKCALVIGVIFFLNSCAEVMQNPPTAVPSFLIDAQKLAATGNQNPRLVVQTGHSKEVASIAFSADGKILASGSGDGTMKLWDVQTRKELRTFTGHSRGVAAVALSPDGRLLASGSWDKTIKLWNIYTGDEVGTLSGHSDWVVSVAFSPNGQLLASGSKDGTIKVWDLFAGRERYTLSKHSKEITSVIFSPDGRLLASSSWDRTIKLWDVQTGKELRTLRGHTREIEAVVFSPDGQILASGSKDGTVKLWEPQTGKELRTYEGHTREVAAVAFSPDGDIIASSSWDHTIKLWETRTGIELRTLVKNVKGGGPLVFHPEGHMLAKGGGTGTIQLWDIQSGQELQAFIGYSGGIVSVDFSPDGHILAGVTWDTTIRLWDVRPDKDVRTLAGHSGQVTSVAFSPDGRILASSSCDTTVKLWDVYSVKELYTLTGHSKAVASVAFSPDGQMLASGGWDNTIKLWDSRSGKELRTLTGHAREVVAVVFSPNGDMLASGSGDATIKLWDIKTGQELHTLNGHSGWMRTIAFSPKGDILASGGSDNIIKLWDVRTGKELRTLSGHGSWIFSVAFHPTGDILASGSRDNTIKLWNVNTGQELRTLSGHAFWVFSVAFSPDGMILSSGSLDKQIKLWDIKSGREVVALISLEHNDWAVVTPRGQFDASARAMQLMHWVVGLEPIELAQLKERYYEPGLLQKLFGFNNEPLRDVPAFTDVRLYPAMRWLNPDPSESRPRILLTNQGGGIGRVVVSINGKEIASDIRGSNPDPLAQKAEVTIDLADHPFLIPGQRNIIEMKAYNAEGYLVSRGLRLPYDAPVRSVVRTDVPHFWGIIVGISDYQGDALDLQFAAKDAENMAKALKAGADRMFGPDKVHFTLLTSPPSPSPTPSREGRGNESPSLDGRGKGRVNLLPTRQNLIKAFETARTAKSTDVLVVYLAGHGVNHGGQDGDYYYPTVEARSGNLDDPAVRAHTAISSTELTELIQQIPALKQVLILDTCMAGRLVEKLTEQRTIPSSQIRALERMKDRVGLHILAGAAADAVSYEASRYGQGLLTYSLLLGLRGAALREGEFIDISKLFEFAADQVPEFAKDIGGIQRPVVTTPRGGSSFDIGRLTNDDKISIPLARVRPLVLRTNFQNDVPPFHDNLALAKWVNGTLREISAQAQDAPLIFVDALELPEAYSLVGRYRVVEEQISVTVYLLQGQNTAGQFTVEGSTSDLEQLAEEIAEQLEKEIVAGESFS